MMIVQNQAQELSCVRRQIQEHAKTISYSTYRLRQITTVLYHDLVILPEQCEIAIKELDDLRVAVHSCQRVLTTLHPQITEQVQPYGCMEKLRSLEERLTELLLFLVMFAPICQGVSVERVKIHMSIRSQFPVLLATFTDAKRQLFALFSAERMGR